MNAAQSLFAFTISVYKFSFKKLDKNGIGSRGKVLFVILLFYNYASSN